MAFSDQIHNFGVSLIPLRSTIKNINTLLANTHDVIASKKYPQIESYELEKFRMFSSKQSYRKVRRILLRELVAQNQYCATQNLSEVKLIEFTAKLRPVW